MLINIFLITHPLKFELLFIYSSHLTLLEFSVMSTIKKKKKTLFRLRGKKKVVFRHCFFLSVLIDWWPKCLQCQQKGNRSGVLGGIGDTVWDSRVVLSLLVQNAISSTCITPGHFRSMGSSADGRTTTPPDSWWAHPGRRRGVCMCVNDLLISQLHHWLNS